MTDLARIIRDSVTETMTAEAIREKVDDRINKLVDEVLTDELRSYNDTGKLIKEKVRESLKVHDLDLPTYGQMITSMLRKQIEDTVSPIIAGKLAEDMEELLKLAPKKIKLSEIVKTMLEESSAYQDGEFGELVTCIVEPNDFGSTRVYLDGEESRPDVDKYLCTARVLIGEDGVLSSATYRDRDLSGKKGAGFSSGSAYGLGQRLQAYYACGTIIEIDEENVSTYRDYN